MSHRDGSMSAAGGCLCGGVRFSVRLPSLFCAHCHCTLCRRAHGAGFVTWFGVAREQLSLAVGDELLVHYGSSDHGSRSFCRVCGSTLFFESTLRPGQVDIVLANMDDPIDRPPQFHAHTDHWCAWIQCGDDLPRLGGESGLEPIDAEAGPSEIPM